MPHGPSFADTIRRMSNDEYLTAAQLEAHPGLDDWRCLSRGAAAWFATASHTDGARLVGRVLQVAAGHGHPIPDLDLRQRGVQVRLPRGQDGFSPRAVALAREISSEARGLGLNSDTAVVQDVQLTMDTADPGPLMAFWEVALGYQQDGEEDVVDPGRRHPPIWLQGLDTPRPHRHRIHLDSVATQEVSVATHDALVSQGAVSVHHGYYATVADPEGNEVDVLPLPEKSDRWQQSGTEDWRLVFAAMACYPVGSTARAADLVAGVASLADDADLPLSIDLRADQASGCIVVTLDTGKDLWEVDEGYLGLARATQQQARALGLSADTARPRFVQIGLDAADIPRCRKFWCAALGYVEDPRPDVTDIVDPRRLGPVLFFQPLDTADEQRVAQRNRTHLDVFLPHDRAEERLDAVLAAGGRVVRDSAPFWWTVADPEGNEVDISVTVGREERWG